MGDAAALPDHHRRRAPAPAPAQSVDRIPDVARPEPLNSLSAAGWLDLFSRIGEDVRRAVLPLSGTDAGRREYTVGAGGDTTMELDRAAETAVFAALETVSERGETFSVLSEEAGLRDFGAPYPLVLVDPVDGSLNAKQGIPLFGLMLAVLDGPTVGDTLAGLVVNLNTGEAWRATREGGAFKGDGHVSVLAGALRDRFEIVGLESTPRALKVAAPLVERASKIRILGSMAISIALTSGGAFDAFCAPIPVRVFDMAASLLVLREAGGVATTIEGDSLDGLRCDLATRATLLCAPTRELHDAALRILSKPS